MSETLYELVKKSQTGNKQSLLEIINTFSPLIKKYSRNLNYDGAETDLIIALIEVVKSLPISIDKCIKKNAQIIGYISISMKNKYIQLSKKNCKKSSLEMSLDIEEFEIQDTGLQHNVTFEDQIFINQLLDNLNDLQKKIIINKFFKDMSDVKIAEELHISRQAVNKTKNKALKKLKHYLM